MGYAVARAARQAGAEVTLVSGPVGLDAPSGVVRVSVLSALDMHAAVMARVATADIFIGVAAVADYRVANAAEHKLKKDAGGIPPIELIENPDILAEVAALADAPFCVGFAAESRNLEAYAQAKRRKKNIPLIAGNLIQDGFGGDDNRLVLFDGAGEHPLPPGPKSVLSRQLIEHIAAAIGKRP
jgi:phosphopantothenoylcysteine decarboxylase/phosphopantothenate--cysteine ligase